MYDFFQSLPGLIVLVLLVLGPIGVYSAIKEFKAWDRSYIEQMGSPLGPKQDVQMKPRTKTAVAIRWLSNGATLVVMWQVVRFCQGNVDAPLIDLLSAMTFGQPPSLKTPGDFVVMGSFFAWCNNVMYYAGGVGFWLFAAVLVKASGWTFARIVEIGFDAYKAEVEEGRREVIRVRRYCRAEACRRESKQSKAAYPWTALAIGIAIGKLF